MWFSFHSVETKFSLDNWSVFLQDGVTLFGSDSNELISIEGITSVGLLGVFFRAVLGMFCHPVVVWLALKSGGGGGGEFPHSTVFTSGADSVCIPLANEGVGLGPFPAGLVASRPPLVGRSASAVKRCFFHQGVFMSECPAHGGSVATLPEVGLPGKGCWRVYRVPQILFVTPLPGVRPSLLFLA